MKTIIKYTLLCSIAISVQAVATPLADYSFKSPAFNGVGYSSHVLTIENQEVTRKAQLQKDIQAALDKAKADEQNTNVAKFLNNLESRIYAQISQNLATSMFSGSNGQSSGTMNFEGNTIGWYKNLNGDIVMNVTDSTGNNTAVTIPLGQFQFPITPAAPTK
jgi:glutamate synthase domain-containing protein 3